MTKIISGLFQDQIHIYYIKKIESKEKPVWFDVGIISKISTSVSHKVLTLEELKSYDLKKIKARLT